MSDAMIELEHYIRYLPLDISTQRQLACKIGGALEKCREDSKINTNELVLHQERLTLRQRAVLAAVPLMKAPAIYVGEKETKRSLREWQETLGEVADVITAELLKPLPKKDESQT